MQGKTTHMNPMPKELLEGGWLVVTPTGHFHHQAEIIQQAPTS